MTNAVKTSVKEAAPCGKHVKKKNMRSHMKNCNHPDCKNTHLRITKAAQDAANAERERQKRIRGQWN